jgi:uncharacterized protein involved in cysteine biosynthesis
MGSIASLVLLGLIAGGIFVCFFELDSAVCIYYCRGGYSWSGFLSFSCTLLILLVVALYAALNLAQCFAAADLY